MICAPCAASPMSREHVAAGDRRAGLLDVLVAADVIRVDVRVDDVADRPLRERADRREDLVRHRRVLRVHDQHAVGADLHGDVAAGADQHVDVALRRLHVDLDVVEILLLRVRHGAPEPPEPTDANAMLNRGAASLLALPSARFGIARQLLPVLRIHRLGAAARRLERNAVRLRVLRQKRIRARQVMRNRAFRAG